MNLGDVFVAMCAVVGFGAVLVSLRERTRR